MARSESAAELRGRRMSNGGGGSSTASTMPPNTHPLQHHLMSPASAVAAAVAKNAYRKTLPSSANAAGAGGGLHNLEDSDGNNADNDSVNSYMSSSLHGKKKDSSVRLTSSNLFNCVPDSHYHHSRHYSGQQQQQQHYETDSVSTLNEATVNQVRITSTKVKKLRVIHVNIFSRASPVTATSAFQSTRKETGE